MNNTVDVSELAAYLHDKDTCSLSDLLHVYESPAVFRPALTQLVRSGALEILPNGTLQWWGTSHSPTQSELAKTLKDLQRNGPQHAAFLTAVLEAVIK